jgi:hypothetical protein
MFIGNITNFIGIISTSSIPNRLVKNGLKNVTNYLINDCLNIHSNNFNEFCNIFNVNKNDHKILRKYEKPLLMI